MFDAKEKHQMKNLSEMFFEAFVEIKINNGRGENADKNDYVLAANDCLWKSLS